MSESGEEIPKDPKITEKPLREVGQFTNSGSERPVGKDEKVDVHIQYSENGVLRSEPPVPGRNLDETGGKQEGDGSSPTYDKEGNLVPGESTNSEDLENKYR